LISGCFRRQPHNLEPPYELRTYQVSPTCSDAMFQLQDVDGVIRR